VAATVESAGGAGETLRIVTFSSAVGLPRARIWAGLACGAGGLILLSVVLVVVRGTLTLAAVVLLYLIPVVIAAVVGGLWSALPAAVAADLVVNFFFVPPYYTLMVGDAEHVIVLLIYVLVALTVSLAVDFAARQRARAARRETEARLLSRASAAPIGENSLPDLLDDIKNSFGMTGVALLESRATGEEPVASVGTVSSARPVLSAPAGDSLRLVAWGPEVFGPDAGALRRMAGVAARALEAQRLAAEAARADDLAQIDRARSALLAAVGHDLRTPLAGIKVAVSSLRQPDTTLSPAAQAELLATIEESTDALSELVDNLLALSRLQAGVLSVHLDSVALDAVLGAALLHLGPRSTQVSADVPDDLPLVCADAGLLERVVVNILSNALTASPLGKPVDVAAEVTRDRVRLVIADAGPGVPADHRDRIFEPFQRLHDRSTTGLGLGLAIARGFTEAMGGQITPAETPGGGLTMIISLPTAQHDSPSHVQSAADQR
jgi:K+-sensing histidine kinase KdpD